MPTTYNVFDVLWNNLKVVISTAWPEIAAGNLFQDISIERRDWVDEVNSGGLAPPWCVVVFEETGTNEWGAQPHLSVQPTIYYITSLKAAAVAGKPAVTFVQGKLLDLKTAAFADLTIGTVLNEVNMDTTASNPVNVSFLANKSDLQGGSIMFTIIVPTNFTITI